MLIFWHQKISNPKHSFVIFGSKFFLQKRVRKTLMKLTPEQQRTLIKLRCDERFTHAFTACERVFKEITLVGSNQGNYFENATTCSKRTLKTTVATQLKSYLNNFFNS